MPKPTRSRASRFAEVARKTGGVFVFATRDATLPNRKSVSAELAGYQYANHHCNKCTATFAFPKATGSQPFCVVCSSGDVDVQEDVKPNIAPDEELSYLSCASCGTLNMFHNALASVGKHIHCSSCGTDMLQTAEAGDDVDTNVVDDAPDVDDMELLDLEEDLEDGGDLDEDGGEEVVSGEDDAPEPATQNPGAVDQKVNPVTTADTDEMPNNDYSDIDEDEDEDVDTVTEAGFKDYSPDKQAMYLMNHPKSKWHPENRKKKPKKKAKADFGTDGEGDDSIEMDLVDLEEEAPTESISFFYGANKVMLSAKDQIIATLAEADAGDFKDMLQTEQFRMSVAHVIETEGLSAAIAQYKFTPSKVKIRLSKVVSMKVEAALKAQRTAVQAGADSYADQFQHSLDIAAAGYAGNFWRNKHDPLKTALIAELTGLGIRKSDKIVDKIFAAYSVSQFREVLEVARDLAKKPVEALNALAETIDLVKYTPTTAKNKQVADDGGAYEDEQDQTEDDETDIEEDEFETATPLKDKATASANNSSYKTPELRSILGNSHSFFS